MPKLHHQKYFAEDALNEESKGLCQRPKAEGMMMGICPPSEDDGHKIDGQMGSKGKRWGGQCSSWASGVVMALLVVVLLVQAYSILAASSVKRDSFTSNIGMLKLSQNMQGRNPHPSQTNPIIKKPIQKTPMKAVQPAHTSSPESRKINLKINQASVENKQPTLNSNPITLQPPHTPKSSENKQVKLAKPRKSEQVELMVPQNSFVPYIPVRETVLSSQNPSFLQQQTQIGQLRIQNVGYMPSYPSIFSPNPVITNDIQFQSFGQPPPLPHASIGEIQPTIGPFNKIQEPQPYQFGYEGNLAGITNSQLNRARSLRELLQNDPEAVNRIALDEKIFYEKRYSIGKYEELPFCIVVPTYNNVAESRYLNNINSIAIQEYSNYHVVIIDDASTDGTSNLIKKYLESQQKITPDRYQIVVNAFQRKAMPNLRMAAKEYCKPQEIFLIVDGDDELVGRQVLKLFNAVFQQKKLWFVYSNFLSMTGGIGFSRPFPGYTIENNMYRTYPFVTSHLRAFYTKLFLNIKEEDLKDETGEYLRAANDVAICIPILQQAHERVGYLPEVTYFYNSNTGLNNHFLRLNEQRTNDHKVRKRAIYKRLNNLMD